jgi:tetratricopeptide (TPR) repeat protein
VAEDVVGSEILLGALNKGQGYSDEALAHFQNALRIDPNDSEALLDVGADFQARGQIQEAIAKYEEALRYVQDQSLKGKILTDLASAYERLSDFPAARQYYRNALSLGPKNAPEAFAGFARTFTDEQIADLSRSLNSRSAAQDYWKLGQLQETVGNNAMAAAAYRHALQIDPKFEKASSDLSRLAYLSAH